MKNIKQQLAQKVDIIGNYSIPIKLSVEVII